MRHFVFALLIVLLSVDAVMPGHQARAEESNQLWLAPFSLTGWAETIQSLRTHSPHDVLTSRARLRLEMTADFNMLYAFVSGDAEKNWQIEDESGLELQEAWLEHAADRWDLRIGRQIIIWGKADGVQITDIISPPDYSESITRDLDEIRMPVNAVKFRLLGDAITTEFIWIPAFEAAVQPTGDNPWAVNSERAENEQVAMAETSEPGTSLENSEVAVKVAAWLSGIDLAASLFYTWDDNPTYHRSTYSTYDVLHIDYRPKHHRLTVIGLECSRPWSDFVFRAEAAYYVGKYHETDSPTIDPLKKDLFKWLGGVDWTPGNNWSVTAQLTGDVIVNYDAALADEEMESMVTLNISKELFNQTLTVSGMLYFDLNEGESYFRPKADYAMTDALHLLFGADIFCGDEGNFGKYENNSQVWIKIKYSF